MDEQVVFLGALGELLVRFLGAALDCDGAVCVELEGKVRIQIPFSETIFVRGCFHVSDSDANAGGAGREFQ